MLLSREYQLLILQSMFEEYPDLKNTAVLLNNLEKEDYDKFIANIVYLQEHGLIKPFVFIANYDGMGEALINAGHCQGITAKGIDFMMQDGGLSAILNTKIVKLHPDTIRDLLQNRIQASSLENKEELIDKIKSIPIEVAKNLLDKLLDKGLENIPLELLRLWQTL